MTNYHQMAITLIMGSEPRAMSERIAVFIRTDRHKTRQECARAMCWMCAEGIPLQAGTTPAAHDDRGRQDTCKAWPIWELVAEEASDD